VLVSVGAGRQKTTTNDHRTSAGSPPRNRSRIREMPDKSGTVKCPVELRAFFTRPISLCAMV